MSDNFKLIFKMYPLYQCIEKLKEKEAIEPRDLSSIRDHLVNDIAKSFNGDLNKSGIYVLQRNNSELNLLQKEFKVLEGELETMKRIPSKNKMKLKNIEVEIKRMQFELTEKSKHFIRNLKSNDQMKKNMKKIENDRALLVSFIKLAVESYKEKCFTKLRNKISNYREVLHCDSILEEEIESLAHLFGILKKTLAEEKDSREIISVRQKLKDVHEAVLEMRVATSDKSLKQAYLEYKKDELNIVLSEKEDEEKTLDEELSRFKRRISDENTIHKENMSTYEIRLNDIKTLIHKAKNEANDALLCLESKSAYLTDKREQNLVILMVNRSIHKTNLILNLLKTNQFMFYRILNVDMKMIYTLRK